MLSSDAAALISCFTLLSIAVTTPTAAEQNKNVSRGTILLLRPIHFQEQLIVGFQKGYILSLEQ